MEIVKAETKDEEEILALVDEVIKEMQGSGIDQWNDIYPPRDIFRKDIEKEELFAAKVEGRIAGIIVLSKEQDKEYEDMEWDDKDGKYFLVHRLAIHPKWHRQGIANKLMDFAEEYAKENGFTSIRLDTYSGNPRSQDFFRKRGLEIKPGHIHFPECPGPYFCYEIAIRKK
jgi:ribosomal protein S18 acetylase RimI-like enzyme